MRLSSRRVWSADRIAIANPASGSGLARFAMPLSTCLVAFAACAYWKIDLDDAFIFYRYARNIASGHGFVYNEGERILGVTSPLYTVVLAAIHLLLGSFRFISLPAVAHVLGAAGLWVTLFTGARVLETEGFRMASMLYPLVFLACSPITSSVGMETFLSLALSMLAIRSYQQHRLFGAALCSALAVLARPDAVIVAALLFFDHLLSMRALPPWNCILVFMAILASWAGFSRMYFGEFLPVTLGAKIAQTHSGRWGTGFIFLRGLETIRGAVWVLFGTAATYLLVLDRAWRSHRALVLILLWNVLYLIAYGFILNPPAYGWYYVPLSIGVCVSIALFIDRCLERLGRASRWPPRRAAAAVGAILFLAALVSPIRVLMKPSSAKAEVYRKAAAWLNENAPEGSSLAANEIGIVGFYYGRGPIIDALGLVTDGVAEHVGRQEYSWYVHHYRPDYLMFNDPPRPILETMVDEPWFAEAYEKAATIRARGRAVGIYRKRA